MNKKISPSVMCADFMQMAECISEFEKNGIEYIHVDIMDGAFVPNYTLGTDFCRVLKQNTDIPLDIHLMVERPEEKLSWFNVGENDYISVHWESTPHIHRALQKIRSLGAKAMIAINPATPINVLENISDTIDGVLIMTVNPGFAGQSLIESTLEKITATRNYLDQKGYCNIEIEVDGNVSFKNAERMSKAGANIFVAGTSSIFKKELSLTEGIKKLRECI